MTPLREIPLREVLACEVVYEDRVVVVLVRREGLKFHLLGSLLDEHAMIIRDEHTLKHLERRFELPIRLLEGDESAFLGVQTLRARREGRDFYQLRVGKAPLYS